MNHYCGYARFPARPVKEPGYGGIMRFVPVHGGLTYAEEDKDGSMVYGFDCAHCGDEGRPETRDIGWLRQECERMVKVIKAAVPVEERYLLAGTSEERAAVLDKYHERMREEGICFELEGNLGAMIALMCGAL